MRRKVTLVVLLLIIAPSIALIYSVVSRTTNPVVRTVAAAAYPGAVAFDPISGRAVVAGNSGEVSLLDTRSGDVLRTLPGRTILGGANVAIDARAGRAIVCDFAGRVRALDIRTSSSVWGLTVGEGLSPWPSMAAVGAPMSLIPPRLSYVCWTRAADASKG